MAVTSPTDAEIGVTAETTTVGETTTATTRAGGIGRAHDPQTAKALIATVDGMTAIGHATERPEIGQGDHRMITAGVGGGEMSVTMATGSAAPIKINLNATEMVGARPHRDVAVQVQDGTRATIEKVTSPLGPREVPRGQAQPCRSK